MKYRLLTLALLGAACLTPVANAAQVRVTVTNLAPQNGTFLTPVWLGFHDGGFDLYDLGAPAASFVERVAEDGNTAELTTAFSVAGYSQQTTLTSGGMMPVFAPGVSNSFVFDLDPTQDRYFSFLSMVIPSNDAFIGNGNPMGHEIFDASGNFLGHDFIFVGANVRDAGSEINDESHDNTAFFGQAAPNTGISENGVITVHSGFIPGGPILSDPTFANADFLQPGYQIARFQVTAVPEPETYAMLLVGLGLVGYRTMRRRKA